MKKRTIRHRHHTRKQKMALAKKFQKAARELHSLGCFLKKY